jgi:hypothetical protein
VRVRAAWAATFWVCLAPAIPAGSVAYNPFIWDVVDQFRFDAPIAEMRSVTEHRLIFEVPHEEQGRALQTGEWGVSHVMFFSGGIDDISYPFVALLKREMLGESGRKLSQELPPSFFQYAGCFSEVLCAHDDLHGPDRIVIGSLFWGGEHISPFNARKVFGASDGSFRGASSCLSCPFGSGNGSLHIAGLSGGSLGEQFELAFTGSPEIVSGAPRGLPFTQTKAAHGMACMSASK